MLKCPGLTVIVLPFCLMPVFANAQWTEPVRITQNVGFLSPRIKAVGDTLHVVVSGDTRIYYLRSNDGGETWTDPICPADTLYASRIPDIAYSNGKLHLVFKGYPEPGEHHLFYTSSTDGGVSWGDLRQISSISGAFQSIRLVACGDTLFVCHKGGGVALQVFRSLDGGLTWNNGTYAEEAGSIGIGNHPNITYSLGRVHLVYPIADNEDTTAWEIGYRYSDDLSETWSQRVYISTPEHWSEYKDSQSPCVCAGEDGNILAFWFDYKYGSECGVSGDILGRVSRDNGDSWGDEVRLTSTQTGVFSACAIAGDEWYAIWMDYVVFGCARSTLMYSRSEDQGVTWTEPDVIYGPVQRTEGIPHVTVVSHNGGRIVHCVFNAAYDDEFQWVFYTKSSPPTGIEVIDTPCVPSRIELSAYPNPFNATSVIRYTLPNASSVVVEVYDILGRKVKTLLDAEQQAGNHSVEWNARDCPSGLYFYRIQAGEYAETRKMVLLK